MGPFSDSQVALLQTFAEQAVIAITSAETYRALQTRTNDLQQSLEYQTATSEVLKVISTSNFALEPVFRSLVYTAVRLCHADQAVIYRVQDGAFRWAAGTDMLPEYERIERGVAIRPGSGTLIGRVALEARPVQILDAWTDPLYEVKDDARAGGVHTLLGVPLLRDGVPIGAIGLARRRVEPYNDRGVELVATFADQAVIAIENARLVAEQREALEQQTATAEVLQVINSSPGHLAPVFDAMLEKAVDLCGAAFGILLTYDGERFHHVTFRSIPAAYVQFMREHPPIYGPQSAPGRLALGERLVHMLDITDTDAYRSREANRRAIADLAGARTLVAVALQKDGALIGAIVVFRQEVRAFSDKQIGLLENFAAQGVIAMENARLITETREALEQQTATAEVLQIINASPGNLSPVFNAMLERAMRLCGAASGGLFTYDGERFHTVAALGGARGSSGI
jgi:two-component system, NtrC family, sensor kinase